MLDFKNLSGEREYLGRLRKAVFLFKVARFHLPCLKQQQRIFRVFEVRCCLVCPLFNVAQSNLHRLFVATGFMHHSSNSLSALITFSFFRDLSLKT